MMNLRRLPLLPLVLVAASGCQLLDTANSEAARGRGSKAFDPYSLESGAVRLSLQWFNGCAVLPTGESLSRGTLDPKKIPYPDKCRSLTAVNDAPSDPTGKLELVSGTNYFLNQLTLEALAEGPADAGDRNYNNINYPTAWMKNQSSFKDLDWTNVGVQRVEWKKSLTPDDQASRVITYGNAAWMNEKNDQFLVEVLDADGQVRSSATYNHSEFVGNGPNHRTLVQWQTSEVNRPLFPNDPTLRPYGDQGKYRFLVRYEQSGSSNPFKTVSTEGLLGEGAIRLTWSQQPNQPYYFPVSFVKKDERPKTCFGGAKLDEPVACEFGLVPEISISPPQNGKFYQPGEEFSLFLALKDGAGNLLHPKDGFPSWDEFHNHQSNGILYGTSNRDNLYDQDLNSGYQIAGPIQDLARESPNTLGLSDYFKYHYDVKSIAEEFAEFGGVSPNDTTQRWPTRIGIKLPNDAKPGTYVASLLGFRQYQGERIGKTAFAFFQVGQEQGTQYPNRIGNCQICHKGTLSLDNLAHGASVDNIEACKICHRHANDVGALVHNIHGRSNKFPRGPNDCSTCHLSRESATKPTVDQCTTCHPAAHGDTYFELGMTVVATPNRYTNCAQGCHVEHTPTQHILPEN